MWCVNGVHVTLGYIFKHCVVDDWDNTILGFYLIDLYNIFSRIFLTFKYNYCQRAPPCYLFKYKVGAIIKNYNN